MTTRQRLIAGAIRWAPLYRLWLRRRGASLPPRWVSAGPTNVALASRKEWEQSCAAATAAGLPLHPDRPKNWDALRTLVFLLESTPLAGRVLDAGGERYSPLVDWLYQYGYRDLWVLNLAFKRAFRRGPIRYVAGDCTQTSFGDGTFDAITCLSVIEHGVDVEAFLAEAARLLRPSGVLVISTDYWPSPLDTRGSEAYGVPVRIFDEKAIRQLIRSAAAHGLDAVSPPDLGASERPIHWSRVDLHFTFLLLAFRKIGRGRGDKAT